MTIQDIGNAFYKAKNYAKSNLASSVSGASTTMTVTTGEGALFPSTIYGEATSAGTNTVLNCTGIGAMGLAVGDTIYNKTDGSWAHVVEIATDSVTTTELTGGSDDTWGDEDEWAVGAFVLQLVQYTDADDETSVVSKRERVLVWKRISDTLYVVSRSFDGETAKAFNSGDFVYIMVDSRHIENIQKSIAKLQYESELSVKRDGSRAIQNNVNIKARNNANSADVNLFKLTTSDVLEFQLTPRLPSARSISNNQDLIDKQYYEANLPTSPTVTLGENIDGSTTPQAVYISNGANSRTAGRIYKADADDTTNEAIRCDGFVVENKTTGQTTGMVRSGLLTFSGLTAGADYYLSTTAGAISTTWSPIKVGKALSTTVLLVEIVSNHMAIGVTTWSPSAVSETLTLTHNLGYIPSSIEIDYKNSDGSPYSGGRGMYYNGTQIYQTTTSDGNPSYGAENGSTRIINVESRVGSSGFFQWGATVTAVTKNTITLTVDAWSYTEAQLIMWKAK